jgi:hypothetical protein
MPWPLYSRERTPAPTELENGWAPEQFWTFLRNVKRPTSTGIQNTNHPARSVVGIPTTLLCLQNISFAANLNVVPQHMVYHKSGWILSRDVVTSWLNSLRTMRVTLMTAAWCGIFPWKFRITHLVWKLLSFVKHKTPLNSVWAVLH